MSSTTHDESVKKRVLSILRILIESPGQFTKAELAERFGIAKGTITRDFEEIKNAGFDIKSDSKHRYFLVPEKAVEQIKELLLITDEEVELIKTSLKGNTDTKRTTRIIQKIQSLSNLPRIGNIVFSKPYLAKTSLLYQAKKDKQKVILHNYRSTNSNTLKDRIVEPFHIVSDEDILHAFDIESNDIRHFRLSRIDRVEQLDDDWENEEKHNIIATDIFKITNKDQVNIHIRIKTGGYNELIERYPLAKAYLSPSPIGEDYDLVCRVNKNFYGLKNFLLGYHEYVVDILENDELREFMNKTLKNIKY
ncbi:Predicted DNA-binding transcriptional regulator YafY, contains an HTH and WYL domains [Spirosomataceae bacterium TFI 002]|nr:Predicted DNA-binding transcriptional regulator YafY, contains an HTH and WYL domains [Spirosomataceae bacterium TFI 002]